MTCRKAMDLFLGLDQEKEISGDLLAHYHSCGSCKTEIDRLRVALLGLAAAGQSFTGKDFTAAVLERLREEEPVQLEVPLKFWFLAGILLMTGVVAIPFSTEMEGLRRLFGGGFDIAVSLVQGAFITLYFLLFVAFNLDNVSRYLGLRRS